MDSVWVRVLSWFRAIYGSLFSLFRGAPMGVVYKGCRRATQEREQPGLYMACTWVAPGLVLAWFWLGSGLVRPILSLYPPPLGEGRFR